MDNLCAMEGATLSSCLPASVSVLVFLCFVLNQAALRLPVVELKKYVETTGSILGDSCKKRPNTVAIDGGRTEKRGSKLPSAYRGSRFLDPFFELTSGYSPIRFEHFF